MAVCARLSKVDGWNGATDYDGFRKADNSTLEGWIRGFATGRADRAASVRTAVEGARAARAKKKKATPKVKVKGRSVF